MTMYYRSVSQRRKRAHLAIIDSQQGRRPLYEGITDGPRPEQGEAC